MQALIVHAHHEPKSFNGAMRSVAEETLHALGWRVEVSDLYAERFQAAAGPADFTLPTSSDRFGYVHEQRAAHRSGGYAADILREQDRVRRADLLVFQFPVWWYAPPAIVKGWADRVLSHGFAYTDSELFDTGLLRGRKAMLALTTGGTREELDADAAITGTVEEFIRPFSGGVLRFVGMDVLDPFVAYAPASVTDGERREMLHRYALHLRTQVTEALQPGTDQ